MPGDCLLDTNAAIALMNGEADIAAAIQTFPQTYLSTIALGELHYGAMRSRRVSENIQNLQSFAQAFDVLDCDATTAAYYGEIKHAIRTMGRPIPDNDMWIAAIARQHGLTLVTRDAHFAVVPDISVRGW